MHSCDRAALRTAVNVTVPLSVGAGTDFFSAVRALGRLPARTCAALHDIARVYAGIF